MNEQFKWKLIYIVAIAILIAPLHMMSVPETRGNAGGWLAQLRDKYQLSEANLGEVDASAETVKLATLGLRGVAVNILWGQANRAKMMEDWSSFGASLTQIAYLQPHFFKVWDYQAHNLTYNTSVEFDDYHDRYRWVIEGIKFLKQGKELNAGEPRYTSRIGWFIAQKIGKADEHRQFRRLFKADDDFHSRDNPNRTRNQRDNWLVGHEYYNRAWAEAPDPAKLKTTPVIFYSQPTMALIYYADAIESDSTAGETPRFGDVAKHAWEQAGKELARFGEKDIPSPYGGNIRLDALEAHVAQEKAIVAQLEQLMPGEFDKLKAERKEKLSAEVRKALETPVEKRDGGDHTVNFTFWKEVAERTAPDRRAKALKLADEYERIEWAARDIRTSRGIVNYDYWQTRCAADQTDEALHARQYMYEAGIERQAARPTKAKKLYEQAFAEWRKVLDKFQIVREDSLMAQDLAEFVDQYRAALRQLAGDDAKFPEKFILQDMLELSGKTSPDQPPTPEKVEPAKKPQKTVESSKEPEKKSQRDEG